MARLLPLFKRAGVTAMFSGHEHNFQHSRVDGIDYLVTGAAGKFREATPDRFEEAHTQSWSHHCHFLLVRIQGDRMRIRAIGPSTALGPGERARDVAVLNDIVRWTPAGRAVSGPIEIPHL